MRTYLFKIDCRQAHASCGSTATIRCRAHVLPIAAFFHLSHNRAACTRESAQVPSREIQLFEPQADELYTNETTSRIVDVPRRTILIYCKHHLLSPATGTTDHGYCFNGDAIRTLRRIEALRTVCGNDFAGIKIILDLTAALERLRSDIRYPIIVAREGRRFLAKGRQQSILCFTSKN